MAEAARRSSPGRRRARVAAIAAVVCLGALGAWQAMAAKPAQTGASALEALEALPYKYELRPVKLTKGARAAFRGKVSGPDKTTFHIGLAIGKHAWPVPVPNAGTENWSSDSEAEYTFTDDTIVKTSRPFEFRSGPTIHTARQARVADEMMEAMESALCHMATGKGCGI